MSDEQKRIILCARTDGGIQEADMAMGSVRIPASCGHEVWLSRSGMQIHLGMGAELLCTECGITRMQAEGQKVEMEAVPGAMAEIEATHGKDAREYSEQLSKLLGIETYG